MKKKRLKGYIILKKINEINELVSYQTEIAVRNLHYFVDVIF